MMLTAVPDPLPPAGALPDVLALLAQPVSAIAPTSTATDHLFLGMEFSFGGAGDVVQVIR
jgi:hypothetical protein